MITAWIYPRINKVYPRISYSRISLRISDAILKAMDPYLIEIL